MSYTDYITIGCSPCEEDCAQVGEPGYRTRAMAECNAFLRQIKRILGPTPEGARLQIKAFRHDFGSYHEVVCHYTESHPKSVEYAFNAEEKAPEYWDDAAKAELAVSLAE